MLVIFTSIFMPEDTLGEIFVKKVKSFIRMSDDFEKNKYRQSQEVISFLRGKGVEVCKIKIFSLKILNIIKCALFQLH